MVYTAVYTPRSFQRSFQLIEYSTGRMRTEHIELSGSCAGLGWGGVLGFLAFLAFWGISTIVEGSWGCVRGCAKVVHRLWVVAHAPNLFKEALNLLQAPRNR